MELGLWVVYLSAAFVLLLAALTILSDWNTKRRERHAHS